MNLKNKYVIDTSALIDLRAFYRRSVFPGLWEAIEELISSGFLICPKEVLREIEKKEDELFAWAKIQKGFVISDEETVKLLPFVSEVDKKYPALKKGKRRSQPNPRSADPWVVGLGIKEGATVIAQESSKPNAEEIRSIPDACHQEAIKCLLLLEWFEELNLIF